MVLRPLRLLEHFDGGEVFVLERLAQRLFAVGARLGKIEVDLLFRDDWIDALLVYPR
jgi:hypothetical protein